MPRWIKVTVLLLLFTGIGFAQCGRMVLNPRTNILDCVGVPDPNMVKYTQSSPGQVKFAIAVNAEFTGGLTLGGEGVATQSWTNAQGFLKSADLSGYATQAWVGSQSYLTSASLTGYATETWVNNKSYITFAALSGYATESWTNAQGFLTSSSLSGYATQAWVNNQSFLTSANLSGYATQSWVSSQGYLLNGSTITVNNNNVGIGTTNPQSLLHVLAVTDTVGQGITVGALAQPYGAIRTAATGNGAMVFDTYSGVSWNANVLTLSTTGNVGIGTTTPGQLLTVRNGVILATGSTINTDRLLIDTDGVNTWHLRHTNDNLDSLIWGNDYGGTFATKVLTLSRVGNVGIGTTAPGARLTVTDSSTSTAAFNDAGSAPLSIYNNSNTANNWTGIVFGNYANQAAGGIALQVTDQAAKYGELAFFTRGSGGWGERMRIGSDGTVTTNGNLSVSGLMQGNGAAKIANAYTHDASWSLEDKSTALATGTSNIWWGVFSPGAAANTIASVRCWADTGDAVIQLRRSDGNDMVNGNRACDGNAGTSFNSTYNQIATTQYVGMYVVSGTAKRINVSVTYTTSY